MKVDEKFDFRKLFNEKDEFYWTKIEKLKKEYNIPLKLILQNYMSFIQKRDLSQLLAYYEIFKKVKHLPGSVAEVGVFMGNSLFTWTKLIETYFPNIRGKKVFGFDNFKGYDQVTSNKDNKKSIDYIESLVGNFKVNYKLVNELKNLTNLDLTMPVFERVKIYNGELDLTFEEFKQENYGVRLKILVVDVNLYIPTKKALDYFYDLMIPGGCILFRGYGVKPWEGESKAVDEFMKERNIKNKHSFDFSMYPSLYIIV